MAPQIDIHIDTNDNKKDKISLINYLLNQLKLADYIVGEVNTTKPWGGYICIDEKQVEKFIKNFFPGLSLDQAMLGGDIKLSPKLLIVAPNERLSWQKHDRRAERWTFLTPGAYYKSATEEQGELQYAEVGDVVQFQQGECHRLNGLPGSFVVVAEIWQHTDAAQPSDEDDITRLQDDYQR